MGDIDKERTPPKTPPPTRELIYHQKTRGIDVLRDPKINKGMAFTLRERQIMGIHGLLPPLVTDQNEQVSRVMANFRRWDNDLDRYIFLMGLQDRNEKLFYRTLMEHVEIMMPVVYTPTVGLACQKYGLIFRKPRGLYITIHDKDHIYEMLCNWPEHDVRAIVVTDGQRILGLGDLGAYGMGIPVGKLSLYTALAGIKPHYCLPIVLDVGTNNKSLLEDPMYIGIRQPRVEGDAYDAFIDEFMEAVVRRYGQDTLVQFEDFGNHNAFRFLEKYRDRYCTFNDDIQGTAAVALAGILASLRITQKKLSDNTFVFFGAGEASIGIAKLVVMAMEDEGTTTEQAMGKIWLVDSKGLIVKDRSSGGLNPEKIRFARQYQNLNSLVEVVKTLQPSVLIGASAVGGAFTDEIIQLMAIYNKRPVIFALSNPTSKAECTAQQAYTQSEGRAVFATGSPFDPVEYEGKTYHTGQGNNSYIFPGVALGVILCGVRHIQEEVFLRSAQALADQVTEKDISEGRVYPPLSVVQSVSTKIAVSIADFVYKKGMAAHYPEPADKEKFIRSQLYSTDYEHFVPELYDWPGQKAAL